MHRKNILDSSNSMCKGPAEEKNLMCLKNLNEATLAGTWGLRKTMTSDVSWKTGEASEHPEPCKSCLGFGGFMLEAIIDRKPLKGFNPGEKVELICIFERSLCQLKRE